MKKLTFVFVIAMMASACAPAATTPTVPAALPPDAVVTSPPVAEPEPTEALFLPLYAPKPSDSNFTRGNIFINESTILLRESFPVQVVLGLGGELPTPCHQLRVLVNPPDNENKIQVEAYTVVNPDLNCIQVVKPFQEMIELGTFPNGHYTIWVNESLIGEFDA